jgi:hypothetical protein
MKPDWDKLGDKYASSQSVQIVDVDCTAGGEKTCQKMGVKGYPTIKYYTQKTGRKGADYQQGRDYASMQSFADKTLNVMPCNPVTLANCAPNEKAFIEKNKDKTAEEIEEELTSKTEELKTMKSEKKAAEKEWAAKQKEWKKKDALLTKAVTLLKAIAKGQ